MSFYAVRVGKEPGVYQTWKECEAQVKGHPKCQYKKFRTRQEAEDFVRGKAFSSGAPASVSDGSSRSAGGSRDPDSFASDEAQDGTVRKRFRAAGASGIANKFLKGTYSSSASSVRRFSSIADAVASTSLRPAVAALTQHDPSRVATVFTDGCCRSNGQAGAVAGIGVYWSDDSPLNIAEPLPGRATNNRAEIHAAARAVAQAKQLGMTKVVIYTDSQFLIRSMTEWVANWKLNDWRGARGPVINKEDFEHLISVMTGIEVEWIHVPGHQGIPGNEAADRLANEGALRCVSP